MWLFQARDFRLRRTMSHLRHRLSNRERLPPIKTSTCVRPAAIRQTPKMVALPACSQIEIRRGGRALPMTGRTLPQHYRPKRRLLWSDCRRSEHREIRLRHDDPIWSRPETNFTTQSAIRHVTTSKRSPNARPDHFHGTHQCDDIADSGAPTIGESTKTQGPEATRPVCS